MRFYRPSTPAADRIEELKANLTGRDWEADWLRETLRERWKEDLPQPFIGFDDQEQAFALAWQGPSEDATLYVYAKTRRGILSPPEATEGEEQEVDVDLETNEA